MLYVYSCREKKNSANKSDFCLLLTYNITGQKAQREQDAKKVQERPEAKISPFGNILRPRLGCKHSPSAECNTNVI